MPTAQPSNARMFLSLGGFLTACVAGASLFALLHEPLLVDEARSLSRKFRSWPVEEVQALACEPDTSAAVRLGCLYDLRTRPAEEGEPRDADVVGVMIRTAREASDEEVREEILKQLSGLTEPALLPFLVECLAGDFSPDVRSEACEALYSYLPDAEARAALQGAADGDPSEEVRREARWYLEDA